MLLELALVLLGGGAAGFVAARLVGRRAKLAGPNDVVEREFRPPESRFEQLLRSLTVGIVTLDGRGRIDSVNAAAATIFDFGSRPVLGRAIIEVVPSFDLDRRTREALAGHPSRGRISLNSHNGTRVLTVATIPRHLRPTIQRRSRGP